MNSIIVGGTFGVLATEAKASSIVTTLAKCLDIEDVVNGGPVDFFNSEIVMNAVSKSDFTIWMPNVTNEEEKAYPKKKVGSFLVCSKVMREGYGLDVPISRIFKMHANAVIAIESSKKPFTFQLLDALGNSWIKTSDISELAEAIRKLYFWSEEQIRYRSEEIDPLAAERKIQIGTFRPFENQEFIDLVKLVADKVEATNVGRFFGNASTRCFKMFPSMRNDNHIYVSPRDIDKKRIAVEDMVLTMSSAPSGTLYYLGSKKPSVDAPVQFQLYQRLPLNYMIHGHSYVEEAPFTKKYYPCGDMREVEEVHSLIELEHLYGASNAGVINLKNHGFLFYAEKIEELQALIEKAKFQSRTLGEKV